MTSRLLHAHLAAHTDEAQQEAHERDEIDAILKLTTAPVEDEDLARLQVRQSELAERDHRRHHLFDDAREQLSTAEKQAKHLEATALARTHNSRNQAHAPAERN